MAGTARGLGFDTSLLIHALEGGGPHRDWKFLIFSHQGLQSLKKTDLLLFILLDPVTG